MNIDDLRDLPSDAAMRFDQRPTRAQVEQALSDEVLRDLWIALDIARTSQDRAHHLRAARERAVQALMDAGLVKETEK